MTDVEIRAKWEQLCHQHIALSQIVQEAAKNLVDGPMFVPLITDRLMPVAPMEFNWYFTNGVFVVRGGSA